MAVRGAPAPRCGARHSRDTRGCSRGCPAAVKPPAQHQLVLNKRGPGAVPACSGEVSDVSGRPADSVRCAAAQCQRRTPPSRSWPGTASLATGKRGVCQGGAPSRTRAVTWRLCSWLLRPWLRCPSLRTVRAPASPTRGCERHRHQQPPPAGVRHRASRSLARLSASHRLGKSVWTSPPTTGAVLPMQALHGRCRRPRAVTVLGTAARRS